MFTQTITAHPVSDFAAEARAGLLKPGQKELPSIYLYDEVGTGRKVQGLDQVLALWRGWATALPDSKATFHSALVSGNTVVLEVTWRGTHTGPLEMPKGPIAATGKRIELRACNVIEISAERGKAKLQRQYFDMGTLLQQLGITS